MIKEKEAERIARLKYDVENDAFAIEIWDEENQEWGLDMSCVCREDWVYYPILTELARLAELGYRIHRI